MPCIAAHWSRGALNGDARSGRNVVSLEAPKCICSLLRRVPRLRVQPRRHQQAPLTVSVVHEQDCVVSCSILVKRLHA